MKKIRGNNIMKKGYYNKKIGRRYRVANKKTKKDTYRKFFNRIIFSRLSLFGLVFCLITICGAQALEFTDVGGEYSSERHDRFVYGTFPSDPVPNPTFFLAEYENQLAGVGWQTNIVSKKAALISPQHFLNANHYKLSGAITFCNQDGELKTYQIESNTFIDDDVAIGRLSAPIPAEDKIPFFSLLSTDPDKHEYTDVIYVGRAPGNNNFAAGRTGIGGITTESHGRNEYYALNTIYVPEEYTIDCVKGVDGDSGSPTFIIREGKLLLTGHHHMATIDYFFPQYKDEVNAILAADGYALDIIDENEDIPGVNQATMEIDPIIQTGGHSQTLVYTVTLINNDSPSRPDSTFTLNIYNTNWYYYWSTDITSTSLILAPGQSGTATVYITAPDPGQGDNPIGQYSFLVTSKDIEQGPKHRPSSDCIYNLSFIPDTTPPTTPTGLTCTGNPKRHILSWNSSWDDDFGVAGYDVIRDDVVIGQSSGTSYTDSDVDRDITYEYKVRAFDAAGNFSPESDPILVKRGQVVDEDGGGGGHGHGHGKGHR